MNSPTTATVFVVAVDEEVRAAMQRLLKTVGLKAEAFASAKRLLRPQPAPGSQLSDSGHQTSRNERTRGAKKVD